MTSLNNKVQPPRRPPDSARFGLARWLGKLHDFILSIVPVGDGRWIAVNSTSSGRRVEFNVDALGEYLSQAVAAGSAADTYNGEFSVLGETDEEGGNSISVVNGGDPTSGTCGTVQVGGEYLSVDTAVENVTGSGVVYLLIDYLPDDDGSVLEWTAEIKTAAAMPVSDLVDGAWVKTVKLADYTVEESGGVTVTQSWTGGAIAVTDRVQ